MASRSPSGETGGRRRLSGRRRFGRWAPEPGWPPVTGRVDAGAGPPEWPPAGGRRRNLALSYLSKYPLLRWSGAHFSRYTVGVFQWHLLDFSAGGSHTHLVHIIPSPVLTLPHPRRSHNGLSITSSLSRLPVPVSLSGFANQFGG